MTTTLPVTNAPTYAAYLEIGGNRFSTNPNIYEGVKWTTPLGEFPVPRSAFRDRYGIQPKERMDIVISDPDGSLEASAAGWFGTQANLTLHMRIDYIGGTFNEYTYYRAMIVTSWAIFRGSLTLGLEDAANQSWETLYPKDLYNADQFPNLYPDHQGLTVPEVVGFGRKVLCARIGAEPDIYGVCKQGTVGLSTVATIYRDNVVAATNVAGNLEDTNGDVVATVGTQLVSGGESGGYTLVTLTFTVPQPANAKIEVDYDARFVGGEWLNAATELARVMSAAGLTINAASLSAAESVANSNQMFLDTVYRNQRTTEAIAEDYLLLLRGNLTKHNAAGSDQYEIIQDVARPSSGTYREDSELIEVGARGQNSRPSKVIVQYGVNPANIDEPFQTISRNIIGGIGGAEIPVRLSFVSTFAYADRYADYLAKRKQFSSFCDLDIYREQKALGDRITLTTVLGGTKDWTIRSVDRDIGFNGLELEEYDAAIYTYTPGPAPNDPSAFQPDYSNTPPAKPTGHGFQNAGTDVDATGKVTAHVELFAEFPAENWARMEFIVEDTVDNTIIVEPGEWLYGTASTFQGAIISNLKPSRLYNTYSRAINKNNVVGIPSDIVQHTSATKSTVPGAVTVFNPVRQGKAKTVNIYWSALSDRDIEGYRIEREITGSDNWVFLDSINKATSFVDTFTSPSYPFNYGTSYTYRIAAIDTSQNQGPWVEWNAYTLVQNIGNDDGNTGDPFSFDSMVTNQATAKELRTSASNPRIEINWGLDNEIQVFDVTGQLAGEFGYISDGGDNYIVNLGYNSFPDFCIKGENSSSVAPTAFFWNFGTAAAISAVSNGTNAISCQGGLSVSNDIFVVGDISSNVTIDISPSIESPGFIWSRSSLYADDAVWVGFVSGINAWRIDRDGPTGELRFYPPNKTTSYWWFNSTGQSGWVQP